MRETQDAVECTIKSIERYRKSPVPVILSLEYIDRRYILYIPASFDFYPYDIENYKECIKSLRLNLLEKKIPQLLSYNLGTSVKKENYLEGILKKKGLLSYVDYYKDRRRRTTLISS